MRQQLLDAVHHLDDVGAGLPLDVDDHGRHLIHPGGLANVFDIVDDVGHLGEFHRGAVAVGHDQGAVIVGGEQLIVGADLVGLVRAVEIPFRLIDVGGDDGAAHVLEVEAVGGQHGGVHLDADGGLLSAADADQADAGQLRDLGGEAGVGQIFHARERFGLGGERQGQNRRVGGVGLGVDGRDREIGGKKRSGGVDGLLHLLLGDIDAEAEVELQGDDRAAVGAGGGHLLQAGHLAELAFQGRGDRRRHDVGAGAGVEGDHLDGGVVHLGQGGNRQLLVRHTSRQEDANHEEGCGNGPENEGPGRTHFFFPPDLSPTGGGRLLIGHLNVDLGPFLELVDAGHHQHVAGSDSAGDFGVVALGDSDGDLAYGDGAVRFDDVDVGGVGGSLDDGTGDQGDSVLLLHQQAHIDELVGEETVGAVIEIGAQAERTGGGVDLVVHRDEGPGADFGGVGAIPGFGAQVLAGGQFAEHHLQIVLGDGEDHADRLDLGDDYEAVGVGGMYDISGIHQAQADLSGDRGVDVGVHQVQFGAIDLRLIGLHHAFGLGDGGFLGGELLFGNGVLREQLRVAIEIDAGVVQGGLVARLLAKGHVELDLVGARVDFHQEIALVDEVAFVVEHLHQLAVYAALHGYGVDGDDRAEAGDVNRDIAFTGLGGNHRDGAGRTLFPALRGWRRCGGSSRDDFGPEVPASEAENGKNGQP